MQWQFGVVNNLLLFVEMGDRSRVYHQVILANLAISSILG